MFKRRISCQGSLPAPTLRRGHGGALKELQEVTGYLVGLAERESAERFLADAILYLEFFGIISVAWQWLKQGIHLSKGLDNSPAGAEADFLNGKLSTMRFFYAYELPKIKGLAERLSNNDGLTDDGELGGISIVAKTSLCSMQGHGSPGAEGYRRSSRGLVPRGVHANLEFAGKGNVRAKGTPRRALRGVPILP